MIPSSESRRRYPGSPGWTDDLGWRLPTRFGVGHCGTRTTTQTHAVLNGSPTIDRGALGGCPKSERTAPPSAYAALKITLASRNTRLTTCRGTLAPRRRVRASSRPRGCTSRSHPRCTPAPVDGFMGAKLCPVRVCLDEGRVALLEAGLPQPDRRVAASGPKDENIPKYVN